jgi:hypothetical protein
MSDIRTLFNMPNAKKRSRLHERQIELAPVSPGKASTASQLISLKDDELPDDVIESDPTDAYVESKVKDKFFL